ncbi:hypothetical protein ISP17_14965 [Dyella ginsengisoli]|uniref:Lipoprotein n=1 Tax=Dyella ginsengisoli TaxID=363848 RepID=A0ABW8JVX9_9GAMM
MKAAMVFVVSSAIVLCGCAQTVKWPWAGDSGNAASPCPTGTCTVADATAALTQASEFCRGVQNYYEGNGNRTSGWRLFTAISGTLAGAVAAPLAKGSAKDAWSGLSGSANGLQQEVDGAFNGVLNAKRRAAVMQAYTDSLTEFKASNDADVNVSVAVSMAAKCAMAPAEVDAAGLQSLLTTDTHDITRKNIDTDTKAERAQKALQRFQPEQLEPQQPDTGARAAAPPPTPSVK